VTAACHAKRGLIALALATLALSALPAQAELRPLWEAGVGVGVIDFPHYRGSDQHKTWVLPAPYFVYRGEYLQVDPRKMRGLFYKSDRAELDVSFNGSVPVESDQNNARRGMPDLDPTLEIGPTLNVFLLRSESRRSKLELRLPLRAVLASDFSHVNHEGWLFQPGLNYDVRDVFGFGGWNAGLLGGPVYSSSRYNQYFYGVDPAFATAARPAYSTGGGYAGTQVIAALSKRFPKFWVGGFAKWDNLNGAVFGNSPLVRDKQNFSAGFAISWVLGESKTRVEAGE
jgi:outer membrane protein